MNLLQIILLLIFNLPMFESFVWPVQEAIQPSEPVRLTEGYMFASKKGPQLLDNSDSFIEIDAVVTTFSRWNRTMKVYFLFYATDEAHDLTDIPEICNAEHSRQRIEGIDWISHSDLIAVKTEDLITCSHITDSLTGIDGQYCQRQTFFKHRYDVTEEGWHNVVMRVCPEDQITSSTTLVGDDLVSWEQHSKVEGTIAFKNPYGYLQAELYGLLPFEYARLIAYIFAVLVYSILMLCNQGTTMGLHIALLLVFLLALSEAAVWSETYEFINRTGTLYCCPYPRIVIAALILQVLRQTFSRASLLIVSLGYGIVRPKLLCSEWTAITIITIAYLITAIIAQSYFITAFSSRKNAHLLNSAASVQVPEFVIDVIFLTWIYLAMGSTIRILTEFKQTVKLRMYTTLVGVIGVFVIFFTVTSILFTLDANHYIDWPWQLTWLLQALWEALNFAILASLAIVCRPTASSRYLAYSSQLPTEDCDDDVEMRGRRVASTSLYDDIDDDIDDEEEHFESDRSPAFKTLGNAKYGNALDKTMRRGRGGGGGEVSSQQNKSNFSSPANTKYDTLPEDGEEDQEYGINED